MAASSSIVNVAPSLREAVMGCPIRASLGSLGHKWALLVLRDIAFYEGVRFRDILASLEGVSPRVLAFRLRELQDDGLVAKVRRGREDVYELTEKGRDTIPILVALTSFGIRHHATDVFKDGRPRAMTEIVPREPDEILGAVATYAVKGKYVRLRPPRARRAASPRKPGRPKATR